MANMHVSAYATLNEARAAFLYRIDDHADQRLPVARAAHSLKYAEALDGQGEYIAAEAAATDQSIADVADNIIAARQRWGALTMAIDAQRVKAKAAVRRAQTPAEMHAAFQRFKSAI